MRRWICREHTCQITTFTEQNHSVCAPRARLGVRAIRWAIRQLRFEGATILGLARQLGTTWNTVWSHIKPCLQAASDDPVRFAGVRVLGVDEHVWHHQDRRRRGPRELTGIVDLTRGKDHPTARLLDLVPGRSGTVHENWLAAADEARISVEVAYHCAQHVREVFHQATPAHGRRLATRLIQRLPTCPIPEIARLGRTLRTWKEAYLAYFDTGGASNAPHRSHQRTLSN